MRQVEYAPKLGGMVQSVPDQTPIDFELLVNTDPTGGVYRARKGWRVVRSVDTWATQADATSSDGFRYTTTGATFKYLAWNDYAPLGAFIYATSTGEDYVLSIMDNYASGVVCSIKTINGHSVYESTLSGESPGAPWTFTRAYDDVFFCGGGAVWRWSQTMIEPSSVTPFRSPQVAIGSYLTSLTGPTITCWHQGSLLYAGFVGNTSLNVDTSIDKTAFGPAFKDAQNVIGGYLLESPTQFVVNQYTVLVSDPLLPACINLAYQGIQLASKQAIVAMTSYMGQLLVWTRTEMFAIRGEVGLGDVSISLVSDGIGCASHRSVVQTDGGLLLWVGDSGIFRWTGSGQPEKVSGAIDEMFLNRSGVALPMGWVNTQAGAGVNRPLGVDLQYPYYVRPAALHLSSAVYFSVDDYYAVAMTAGSGPDPNNLIICYRPSDGKIWLYASFTGYVLWESVGGVWTPIGSSVPAVSSSMFTLLTTANDPTRLYGQGGPTGNLESELPSQRKDSVICVMDHTTDQNITFGPTDAQDQYFDQVMLSSRIFLGDATNKAVRRLNLRMFGTRRNDFLTVTGLGGSEDTYTPWLAISPEQDGFDVQNQADTAGSCVVKKIEPWPDAYHDATYFWQKTGNSSASVGRWDNGATTADKNWLGKLVFDKRIDLAARISQFVRVGLWKRVDGNSDPSLEVLSAGMQVIDGYGDRR